MNNPPHQESTNTLSLFGKSCLWCETPWGIASERVAHEYRTFNLQGRSPELLLTSMLDVRCWMLDTTTGLRNLVASLVVSLVDKAYDKAYDKGKAVFLLVGRGTEH